VLLLFCSPLVACISVRLCAFNKLINWLIDSGGLNSRLELTYPLVLKPEVIQNWDRQIDRQAGGQRNRRTSDLSQLTPAYSGRQIHRPVPVSQLPVENAASHRHPGIHTITYTGHVTFVTIPINLLTYLLTLWCSQQPTYKSHRRHQPCRQQ